MRHTGASGHFSAAFKNFASSCRSNRTYQTGGRHAVLLASNKILGSLCPADLVSFFSSAAATMPLPRSLVETVLERMALGRNAFFSDVHLCPLWVPSLRQEKNIPPAEHPFTHERFTYEYAVAADSRFHPRPRCSADACGCLRVACGLHNSETTPPDRAFLQSVSLAKMLAQLACGSIELEGWGKMSKYAKPP